MEVSPSCDVFYIIHLLYKVVQYVSTEFNCFPRGRILHYQDPPGNIASVTYLKTLAMSESISAGSVTAPFTTDCDSLLRTLMVK